MRGFLVLFLVAVFSLCNISCSFSKAHALQPSSYEGFYDKAALAALKDDDDAKVQENIAVLKRRANHLLQTRHYPSVTDKKELIAPGETKHDFITMTPYLWADAQAKSGYVVKDGVDNPLRLNNDIFDHGRLRKMVGFVHTLSMAYAITGDKAYAQKAADYLRVWFINPETKMAPQMKYAQIFVPKNAPVYYSGSSMIAAQPLLQTVHDIYLLKDSGALSPSDQKALQKWFGDFKEWLLKQNLGGIKRLRINNHGTWLQCEIAAFSQFAGDEKQAREALLAVGPSVITPQIQKSGKIPTALIRTKSVAYTEYNLEAFIMLAHMGEKLDVPIWRYRSPDGGNILHAVDFLNKYLQGKEKWPYQNITGKDVHAVMTKQFMPYMALAYKASGKKEYLETVQKYLPELSAENYLWTKAILKEK